jgi:hypothetical protein
VFRKTKDKDLVHIVPKAKDTVAFSGMYELFNIILGSFKQLDKIEMKRHRNF